jgi:hypothetical protein
LPLKYTIDHSARLVHVECTGTVKLQEILDYLDAVAVGNAMPYDKLFDTTKGQFPLSDEDMMTLGARVSAYAHMDPRGPVALVVGNDETNLLAHRFANLGGASRPAKVFRTVDEARAWLSSQAKA